jgi:preprotein translocase subunit SecG
MYQALIIIIVIAAILLTLVVLVQNSKGGGLAAGFASANQVLGVKQTTEKIEKFTWILVGVIVVLCVFSSRMIMSGSNTEAAPLQVNTEQAAALPAPQQQTPVQP